MSVGELVTLQNAATGTGNGTEIQTSRFSTAAMVVTGTFVATITFEGSPDGSTWNSLEATNTASGALATTATATGTFTVSCGGLAMVRARISAYTSGSVTVKGRGGVAAGAGGGSGAISDTELPAAAALADATANPTVPAVGTFPHIYNGTTWDRAKEALAAGIGTIQTATGVPLASIALYRANNDYRSLAQANAVNDADTGEGTAAVHGRLYNDTNYDRQRGNTSTSLLASAARTTTQTSADQTNYNARGIRLVLDVTSAGTGSITLTVDGKDANGIYYNILTGAAVTTTGTNVYRIYPGITTSANVAVSEAMPRTFRVVVTANNANSVTYSLAYSLTV